MSQEARGLVMVFTGHGKGKTTAALGVALRALGHGLRVHIVLFMKGNYPYGEQPVLEKLPNVTLERFGSLEFVDPAQIKDEERAEARRALEASRQAVMSGNYDLVVLDEINLACGWGLIGAGEVLQLLRDRPPALHLILTGRHANPRIIEAADIVTEMVEVKHPFRKGQVGLRGIDY